MPPFSWGFTPGYRPKPLRGEEKSDFDGTLVFDVLHDAFGSIGLGEQGRHPGEARGVEPGLGEVGGREDLLALPALVDQLA